MSYLKPKMHQIRFWLGSAPDLTGDWGAYSASPDPLAILKGPSKGKARKGRGGDEGKEREGKLREGRKGREGKS